MPELLGVVLCGGESRRMGRDKGLLSTGDRPWALVMGDKARRQGLRLVYSINQKQVGSYSAIIPPEQLIVDSEAGQGPLNGLFSVHRRFPAVDLLLLACDMPDLDEDTLSVLIAAWDTGHGESDFFVYEVGGVLQPFCAIYTAAALARALHRQQDGSLQHLLRGGNIRRLDASDPETFRNYNTV